MSEHAYGPNAGELRVLVGTQGGRGIHLLALDPGTGALTARDVVPVENAIWLARDDRGATLHAACDIPSFEGRETGAIATIREATAGRLSVSRQRASEGRAPCYLSLARSGRWLFAANYVGGNVAVFPLDTDGAPGTATDVRAHAGRGPHPVRQNTPHPHCIIPDPAGRFVLVADLGIDRVLVYAFDDERGVLTLSSDYQGASGAGPRHIAFSPDGRMAYIANELDSTISVCDYDSATGRLRQRQRLSTIRQAIDGNTAAHVAAHPSGRTVHVSNRGEDTIATFAVSASGELAHMESIPSGGVWPRHFAFDSDGRFLVVANQRSDAVVAFRVDHLTGRVVGRETSMTVPGAICVLMLGPA